jgi:hypothetical protein
MKSIYILTLILILSSLQLKAQTTITLNGIDNKVSVPKNGNGVMNDFTTPHDFTIEIRFKYNSIPSGTVFSKHATPANGFFIEIIAGEVMHSGFGYNYGYSTITGANPLHTNQIYHAALSYEVASNSFKLYLDGQLLNTQIITSYYVPNIQDYISIGSSDHWGGFSDLTLDYFRIWDIQKSDSDIISNKDIEVDCSSTNLLLQYKFDSGTTITDCTSNNNTGIFFGATLSTPELEIAKTLNLFPNPSNNFIQISGLTKNEKYTIYNVLGNEITNGVMSNKEKIDTQNLSNGLYFIKFENKKVLKFIKK